jgi:hypothetical protein
VKGCHTWPVLGHAYVMYVRFSPIGCTSIRIVGTLSDMNGGLFAASSHSI